MQKQLIPDRVIMYASLFSYEPSERNAFINYRLNEDKIRQFEGSNALPFGSLTIIQNFLSASEDKQREDLDNPKYLKEFLRVLFKIVENVHGVQELVYFALVLINGIFEDSRQRIRHLCACQRSHNDETKFDAINILMSFLHRHN
jgi:hypothetical protein